MKTMRMVVGIISIVLFMVIIFQSCAAGIVDAVQDKGGTSGGSGLIVGVIMLMAGIIGIAARKSNGGAITSAIFYTVAGLVGIASKGAYKDLLVWGVLCFIFAALFYISVYVCRKDKTSKKNEPPKEIEL